MQPFTNCARQIARGLFFVSGVIFALQFGAATATATCPSGPNKIVTENSLAGNPPSEWDVTGSGDATIQGFATDISFIPGQTVQFKINTTASAYHIDIYRLGYYGGNGARKIDTILDAATTKTVQVACLNDESASQTTHLVDCGNWSVSASWVVPSGATSGIYIARLVREDTLGASHIVFIVRDDECNSNLLFQTSDLTWQAYNTYGPGSPSLYYSGLHAYKVSYNRPFITRAIYPDTWVFNAEFPMIRFLERNGFDVSYSSGVDTARFPANLRNHKVFMSVGHDEYVSGDQRSSEEAAQSAGVHLAFFSGNNMFWKTRFENNFTGTLPDGTPTFGPTTFRTLVGYKETESHAKIDPSPQWTGSWRDAQFSPPSDGGRPENGLTGTIFVVNNNGSSTMEVPADDGKMRLWRNTSIAALAPGTIATLPLGVLGYEWNEDLDNGFRPAGQIRMSTTIRSDVPYLQDAGSRYAPGTATHHVTLHRTGSALVFSSGSVQWSWGLDGTHDRGPTPAEHTTDARLQQATVNLLAEMGAQPQTLQGGLVAGVASADVTPPTSTITSPASGATLPSGTQITITGTAADSGGGVVGGVEVSTDGGSTWHPATGRESWTYKWTPSGAAGTVVGIQTRGSDDSVNLGTPSGITVTLAAPTPINCPCSIWSASQAAGADPGDSVPVNLGMKFRTDIPGYIKSVRFYKHPANVGPHIASLWTAGGTSLATATFTGESPSGWQEVVLSPPVAVAANTTYVVSYHAPNGHYAKSEGYFSPAGVDNPPLHALAEHVDGSNGVFVYGSGVQFPTSSSAYGNYWVDVTFDTTAADTTPPTVIAISPAASATGASVNGDVTATFSEPMNASTIDGTTLELRDPSNALVPATVTYLDATRVATLHPTSTLAFSTTYTFTVKGGATDPRVKDLGGNAMAANFTSQFTTAADSGCPCSLWNNDPSVVGPDSGDPNAITLGMKFRSSQNGYIKALRFYRTAANNGVNTGYLWNVTGGTPLATATFASGTAAGWQEVTLPTPVPINANVTYIVGYHTTVGHFASTPGYFNSSFSKPPLLALANGFDGANSVYVYGEPADFPRDASPSSNYWSDVVFDTATTDHTPPTITAVSPASGATVVSINTNVTATFSKAVDAASVTTAFELRNGATLISASVTYDGTNHIATLQPSAPLNNSTTYTATVHGGAGGVKDLAGNALASDQSWSFTTAAPPPTFTSGGGGSSDITVRENSGPYSNTWATNITGGPVVFSATVDNTALFATQPGVSPSGVLTFTPADNAFGDALVTVQATNSEGTSSSPKSFMITVTHVNQAPTFTSGANVMWPEDTAYSAGWATAISPGPNESSQTVSFTVTNDNPGLFAIQPAISPTGLLTYTPASNAHMTATVSVYLKDNGGTADGGIDTSVLHQFTIQVTPVNDAPSFAKGADQRLLDTAGAQTLTGWATNLSAGPPDEAGQALNFIVSNDHNAFFSAQPQVASNGTLTFTPAVGQSGVAIVSVQIHDDGGTVNGGVDTSAVQTFTITIDKLPAITSANATTFTAGALGTFTVTTTGSPRPAITRGGVALPAGVTFTDKGDGTGTLTGTPASGSGSTYAITFTANNGLTPNATQNFTLTVNEAPAITTQPANQTLCAGFMASFTAAAGGFPAPTVQWQVSSDGIAYSNVAGATSTTLTFTTVAADNGKRYQALFTNGSGTTATNAATLTVNTNAATINAPASVCALSTGNTADGPAGETSYAWTIGNGVITNGQNVRTVTFTAMATGTVDLTLNVTNAAGCTASNTVHVPITLIPPTPTITPGGPTTFCQGGSVTLTSSSTTANQWFRNTVAIVGATNPQYIANSSGDYTVQVVGPGCTSAPSAPTTVTVNPIPAAPTITPGGPTTFCQGGSVILSSSSTSGNQWLLNNAAISGATNQTYTASGAGSYTVQVTSGGCASTPSAATTVTVNPTPATPTITPGGPTTFCQGGSVILSSSSTSGNQWLLNNAAISGATNQTYTASGAGSYTVQVTTGGCASTPSAATTVTVNPTPATPTITPGGPTTFCQGGSVILSSSSTSGNQWLLNNAAISGATNQTYTASGAGSYTVQVTSGGCASTPSAATTVTVNPTPATPTITPGGPTTFCQGGSVILSSSSTSGNQWLLNNAAISGATNQTYTASGAGSYTVQVTSGGCASTPSAATTVTVNPTPATPTITPGGPTTFCQGGSVILSSSSTSGNQWLLNNAAISGATNQTYTASGAGSYTVQVTSGGCASTPSAATTVTVNPTPATPTITPGGPTTFCQGGSVILSSSSTSGNQWLLNNAAISGATNQTYTASGAGSYTVQVTSGGCASTPSAATTVTVNPTPATPTITPGGPTTFCQGGSVILSSSSTSGNQWLLNNAAISGATNQTYTASGAGSYTVQVTSGGCPSTPSAATTVTVNPTPATPTITPGGPTTFCQGGSVILSSSSTSGNQWLLNNAAISGATNQTYTASGAGSYTVQVTSGGCASTPSAATTVTVNPTPATPTITPGGPTTFCQGGSVILSSSSTSGNQWLLNNAAISGATNQTYTASGAGNYTVQVTNGGCASTPSAATTVTVNPTPATPTITPGGPTTFCQGGSVILSSSSTSGNQWLLNNAAISGATNQTYTASGAGSYTVQVTSGGCASTPSAATTVTVNPTPATPTITPGGPTTFCQGGSVILSSSSTSGNQWLLNNAAISGATNQTYTASGAGSYTVQVTSGGCASTPSAATTVTVNPTPATPTITPGGPTTFCQGGSVILSSSSTSGNQWLLNNAAISGATNQTYTASGAGSYTVQVTTGGCASTPSAATTVTVNPTPATPTITPGGPTTFCQGGSVILSSSSTSGNQWLLNNAAISGATNQTYTASGAGSYTVQVTSGGCASTPSAATTVTVNPTPATPTITPSGSAAFCPAASVTLTSSSATGNQWYRDNSLISGATGSTYSANIAGSYTVIVTTNGCSSSASAATSVSMSANPAPPLITAPASVNANSTGNVASGPAGAASYSWSISGGTIPGATNGQSVTFTAGASGSVTLTLMVTNAAGCSASNSAVILIASNHPPVANNDSYSVLQNNNLIVLAGGTPPGVLANDTDADGDALTALLVSNPAHGTVVLNLDGGFTYIPVANYYGQDAFTYRARDAVSSSNVATVNINVFLKSFTQNVASGGTLTTDTEGDGATPADPLEASVTLPTGVSGNVSISIGLTPVANVPPGGFSYFNYQADITAPAASVSAPLQLVFRLDSSIIPPGQNKDTVQAFRSGTPVADCTTGISTPISPDPCVAIRALNGDDVSLTIYTSSASTWNFGKSTANTPPTAVNDSYNAVQETLLSVPAPGVIGNDTDPDRNTLTAALVTGPAHAASFALNANGSFTYTPTTGYVGPDSFTYKDNDGTAYGNVATANITVNVRPAISVDDISLLEGNTGLVYATFHITLSATTGVPVSVTYATANDTALSGEDYYARTATVTIPPGVTGQNVSIQIRPDTKYELDERFFLNLSAPVNATIARGQGACIILNDDPVPTVSINSFSIFEGNVGFTNAVFTVTLTNPSYLPITVNYATANGTATAPKDYIAASGTLTIPAGLSSKTITVQVVGNTIPEPNKTFTVTLSSPTNVTMGTATGTCTILNDD